MIEWRGANNLKTRFCIEVYVAVSSRKATLPEVLDVELWLKHACSIRSLIGDVDSSSDSGRVHKSFHLRGVTLHVWTHATRHFWFWVLCFLPCRSRVGSVAVAISSQITEMGWLDCKWWTDLREVGSFWGLSFVKIAMCRIRLFLNKLIVNWICFVTPYWQGNSCFSYAKELRSLWSVCSGLYQLFCF